MDVKAGGVVEWWSVTQRTTSRNSAGNFESCFSIKSDLATIYFSFSASNSAFNLFLAAVSNALNSAETRRAISGSLPFALPSAATISLMRGAANRRYALSGAFGNCESYDARSVAARERSASAFASYG